MVKQVQRVRHTESQADTFTGLEGEITIDTTNNRIRSHDGSTAGGHPHAKVSDLVGYQPVDALLTAIAGLDATTGFLVMTAAAAVVRRSIEGTANQIAVADGDGVSGNPILSLVDALQIVTSVEAPTGIFDAISEKTADNGVVIDGVTLKDGNVVGHATDAELTAHSGNTSNPHSVTKTQLGLENVLNVAQLSAGDIGSTVQAYSALLAAIAGLTPTDGNIIVGNGSTFVAENGATARASLGAEAADAAILKSDTTATLTVGYDVTSEDAGTKDSGAFTPDPADGNFQYALNNGAHTLNPPASDCAIVIQYTNGASAGTITTGGFTLVDGDPLDTGTGNDFFLFITRVNGFSSLTVKALQ